MVLENDCAHIAHVGDSRIYKIADGNIIQFTNDHTEVGEMFRKGILNEEEAKNHPSKSVLVRAMGIEADIEVDLIENIAISNGDSFVLCSDGLAKVGTEEIKMIVLNNSAEVACKKLISLANESGGKDNVTVQVIKIISDQAADVPEYKPIIKKSKSKWLLITLLVLLLAAIVILGIMYQKNIWNFFSASPGSEIDTTAVVQVNTKVDVIESILLDANNYLTVGNLDSALALYQLILNENPLHVGALSGIESVELKYIKIGNEEVSKNKNDEALLFFKKAFALNPNNKDVATKIISLQEDIKVSRLEDERKNETVNKESTKEKSQQLSDSKNNPGGTKQSYISAINSSEWKSNGLSEKDYTLNESGFTFFNTSKSKKIIYNHQLVDIDVEVELRFDENSANNKAGIILGYTLSENNNIESYYLFTVDNSGSFSLLKIYNDKEEVLISAKRSADLKKKNLVLKVKCLGPWIMLYTDNKLLESYLNADFIKGKIGLFSQHNTHAEFTDLNISSAFEKNK